jgi:hypothetical protein
MLAATVSAGVDETTSGNPVDGRRRDPSACAIALTSGFVPSTTMLLVRVRSNGAPAVSVSDVGAGISCGPVTTGRGVVVVGEGTVEQAANTSVAESITARDM